METRIVSGSSILIFSNQICLTSYISQYEEISNEEGLKPVFGKSPMIK